MTGPEPLLRVVAGRPTDEETAALAVVLAAKLAAGPARTREERSAVGGWADRAMGMRVPLTRGPGAWRRSGSLG